MGETGWITVSAVQNYHLPVDTGKRVWPIPAQCVPSRDRSILGLGNREFADTDGRVWRTEAKGLPSGLRLSQIHTTLECHHLRGIDPKLILPATGQILEVISLLGLGYCQHCQSVQKSDRSDREVAELERMAAL